MDQDFSALVAGSDGASEIGDENDCDEDGEGRGGGQAGEGHTSDGSQDDEHAHTRANLLVAIKR